MNEPSTLGEWLRESYRPTPDCPPAEQLLAHEIEALSAADRDALEAHIAGCPRCLSERALAEGFGEAGRHDVESEDLDFVVARLEKGRFKPPLPMPERAPATTQSAGGRYAPGLLRAAAALVLLSGLAAFWMVRPEPPTLPLRPTVDVVRSLDLELHGPIGERSEVPSSFSWEPVVGAGEYRIELSSSDHRVIWRTTVAETRVDLPVEIDQSLATTTHYSWVVHAVDSKGVVLARSAPAVFWIPDPSSGG